MSRNNVTDLTGPGDAHRRNSSDALRRAWEHLARIDILESSLAGQVFCDVSGVAALALEELNAGRDRTADDLLRVAEHLCFAAQSPGGYAASTMRIFAELRGAIDDEFDSLLRRAELFRAQVSSERHGTLPDLCARTLHSAREAYAQEFFGRALELARAANLLAEIVARTSAFTSQAERIAS